MMSRSLFNIVFIGSLFGLTSGFTGHVQKFRPQLSPLLQPWTKQTSYSRPSSVLRAATPVDGANEIDKIVESGSSTDSEDDPEKSSQKKKKSKNDLLGFAVPALGIVLANPLLSNIDNIFVGRTAGTAGLAALSPATICTDQMLYLFQFLSMATTGMVSRAYAANEEGEGGDVEAARQAASAPLTASLVIGAALTLVYAFCTPTMLRLMNVRPEIRAASASYILWRGAIPWAALAQSVSLSVLLATRDAITPLKIVSMAAFINIIGDALLCVWPLQWGCAGAAAATAFATLFSSGYMMRVLSKKKLLPQIRLPTKKEMSSLLMYTGPLMLITINRLVGFLAMQKAAMRLGVDSLAAYQICFNTMIFFFLFGEPLGQLFQAKLPPLVDREDRDAILSTIKSVLSLAAVSAVGIGLLPYLFLTFGSQIFSSDLAVQALAKKSAPAIFGTIATAIMTVTIDGAMVASKEFNFLLGCGLATGITQLFLLTKVNTLGAVFATFGLRLGVDALGNTIRTALGRGNLGRIIRKKKKN